MAGRPKLEDSRTNQYRVRLNDEENEMLNYVSEKTEKPKSEVFRQALSELYEKTKLAEAKREFSEEYEPTWEEYHISLERAIDCPFCGHTHMMNFQDDCEMISDERSMGPEIQYIFNLEEYSCDECGKRFKIEGTIVEYPMGVYDHEDIDVEKVDSDDEDEE